MQSKITIHSMSRRAFGKLVAMSAGAVFTQRTSGSASSLPADKSMFPIFAFYPLEDGKLTNCNACLSHAAHKRFATSQAAESNRAHAGCRCLIHATSVSKAEYLRMFGGKVEALDRLDYDLRWLSIP